MFPPCRPDHVKREALLLLLLLVLLLVLLPIAVVAVLVLASLVGERIMPPTSLIDCTCQQNT